MNILLDLEFAREHQRELLREAEQRQLAHRLSMARTKASEPAKRNIEVRWGLAEDEPKIAELFELNGMSRRAVFEEQFIVAEEDGEILAAMSYRTVPKRLVLGLLVADPWGGERELAAALYAGVRGLAQEMGAREILAQPDRHRNYPREAGYRRRAGGWRLDTTPLSGSRAELPAGVRYRIVALLEASALTLFRAFRG